MCFTLFLCCKYILIYCCKKYLFFTILLTAGYSFIRCPLMLVVLKIFLYTCKYMFLSILFTMDMVGVVFEHFQVGGEFFHLLMKIESIDLLTWACLNIQRLKYQRYLGMNEISMESNYRFHHISLDRHPFNSALFKHH